MPRPRTVTAEEMKSRQRICSLESAIGDAIHAIARKEDEQSEDRVTYGELICAMSRVLLRWADNNWQNELQER